MKAALNLWLLLRRRSAGTSDPQKLTGVLATAAFAVTTAIVLIVLGGLLAFINRAAAGGGTDELGNYVIFATIATLLLAIPLSALGGAAARLAVARRDARLAALRLAGATTSQVTLLTLFEAGAQALVGALIGVAGYFALIPAILPITFQEHPFSYGELVVPWWVLPATVAGVLLIALGSAAMSLRKVAVTPLGVAARVAPKGLHWTRVLPLALMAGAFALATALGGAGLVVLVGLTVGGLAAMNLVGPLVVGMIGRIWAGRARTAASLIAARRLIDSPKTAWRSVGGVGLATFVAGMTAALAMFSGADVMSRDIATGGALTLVIAAVTAAVSTGVMQSGRVIDQRNEYRTLALAGTDLSVMNKARMLETQVPLVAAVLTATATVSLFLIPALGSAVTQSVPVLIQFALSVAGAVVLVLLGAAASGRVMRSVLA